MEEEVKTEETAPVDATVMDVPVDEYNFKESAEDLDSYKLKDIVSSDDEKVKKIIADQREYLLQKAKESDLNWDEIEIDDDGHTPKITDEDKAIYAAATDDIFDAETLDVFISSATANIDSYIEMKSAIDAGVADEDDLEYFETVSKMYEDSRVVLAMIQKGARDLVKELNENQVTESVIKGATLKTIRDFIVSEYKYTGIPNYYAPKDFPKYDRTKTIETEILKTMFPVVLLRESIYRDVTEFEESPTNNSILSPEYFANHSKWFIFGLQKYLTAVSKDNPNNIDMTKVIYRDFRALDFINPVVTYALAYTKHPIGVAMKFEESSLDSMKNTLNPNDMFAGELKGIVSVVDESINALINNLDSNIVRAKNIVLEDKIWSELSAEEKEKFDDYSAFIAIISNKFPQIDGLRISPWGKVFSFMEKYQNYTDFKTLSEEKDKVSEEEFKSKAFIVVMNIAKRFFIWKYADIIDDINISIKESVPKHSRDFMFGAVINSIVLQHNLAFKTPFDPATNAAGDQLYELAEKTFSPVDYKLLIGDKNNDILLRDVNLCESRRAYLKLTAYILEFIRDSLATND